MILEKGELQISPKEREQLFESTFKEIANVVQMRCLNPDTNTPYTTSQIEKAMKDVHFTVKLSKGTKQQALEVIKKLSTTIKIERAKMRLSICLEASIMKQLKDENHFLRIN